VKDAGLAQVRLVRNRLAEDPLFKISDRQITAELVKAHGSAKSPEHNEFEQLGHTHLKKVGDFGKGKITSLTPGHSA
jgi:hypothetical protein